MAKALSDLPRHTRTMRSDVGSTFLLLSCGSPLSCRSRSQPSFVVHRSPLVSLIVGSPHPTRPATLPFIICLSDLLFVYRSPSNCQLRTRAYGIEKFAQDPSSGGGGKMEGRGDAAVCVSCYAFFSSPCPVSAPAIHNKKRAETATQQAHTPRSRSPAAPVQHPLSALMRVRAVTNDTLERSAFLHSYSQDDIVDLFQLLELLTRFGIGHAARRMR